MAYLPYLNHTKVEVQMGGWLFSILLGELLREALLGLTSAHCSVLGLNYLAYAQPSSFRLLVLTQTQLPLGGPFTAWTLCSSTCSRKLPEPLDDHKNYCQGN